MIGLILMKREKINKSNLKIIYNLIYPNNGLCFVSFIEQKGIENVKFCNQKFYECRINELKKFYKLSDSTYNFFIISADKIKQSIKTI